MDQIWELEVHQEVKMATWDLVDKVDQAWMETLELVVEWEEEAPVEVSTLA
jgi:hypothetical protein